MELMVTSPASFVRMASMRKASYGIIRSEDERCRSSSSAGAGLRLGQARASADAGNSFAEGARLSKEFAAFFKICLDRYPITGRSFEWFFDIDGDLFERQAPSERLQAVEGLCRGSSRREMAGVPAEHRAASATFMPKHRLFTMHHILHRFGV